MTSVLTAIMLKTLVLTALRHLIERVADGCLTQVFDISGIRHTAPSVHALCELELSVFLCTT